MKFLKDQSDLIAVAVLVIALASPAPVIALHAFVRDRLNSNLHLVHYEQPTVVIVHE
jgi:hypothetical protein